MALIGRTLPENVGTDKPYNSCNLKVDKYPKRNCKTFPTLPYEELFQKYI